MTQDTEVQWGPAIAVVSKPRSISNGDLIRWSNNGRPYHEVRAGEVRQWGDDDNRIMIRVAAGHRFYAEAEEAIGERL